MPNDLTIRHVGPGELTDPALLDQVQELEAQAERDVQGMNVNFRWGREQVAIVKQAARAMGLPYQVYIKHVALKQALADLQAIGRVTRATA
jgi:predicted DNA binding CopG/RHH family protein